MEAPLSKLASILPDIGTIKVVDVGAMSLGEGQDPYHKLAQSFPTEVIGFEPVQAEFAKLVASGKPGRSYLPYAIGDGAKHRFHECNYPMTSSLFPPNGELVRKFQYLDEFMQVVSVTELEKKRLDDIPELVGTDYLKLDIQGAELMVLKAAERLLEDVLIIHTEVEFVPLYKDQPLFGDVDGYLRSCGFAFHRFAGVSGRAFKPLIMHNNLASSMSQSLWADAIFVKNFMDFDKLPVPKLLKLAVVLHENYKSFDLAALALSAADAQSGSALQPAYLQMLTGGH
jgi:FkbM family methyltransferase